MQKVKIFKSVESELNSLEHRINDFLAEHAEKVVQITGNIAGQSVTPGVDSLGQSHTPSDVLVIVLYEPKA